MSRLSLAILSFPVLLLMSCTHQPMIPVVVTPTPFDECSGITPVFDVDIQPIFKASCAKVGCHDGDNMSDYSVYKNIERHLNDSAMYYYVIIDRSMPQDEPLDSASYKLVKCWLNNGHPKS